MKCNKKGKMIKELPGTVDYWKKYDMIPVQQQMRKGNAGYDRHI